MWKKKLSWQISTNIFKKTRKHNLYKQILSVSLIKVMYETYNIVVD